MKGLLGMQSEKPTFRYKSLEDYRRQLWWRHNNAPAGWPCMECRGGGWVYDPNDAPDVIEGYKSVRRLTCPVCKGSKEGPRAANVAVYTALKRRYLDELREWRYLRKIWRALTLTDDQAAAIKAFGVPVAKLQRSPK